MDTLLTLKYQSKHLLTWGYQSSKCGHPTNIRIPEQYTHNLRFTILLVIFSWGPELLSILILDMKTLRQYIQIYKVLYGHFLKVTEENILFYVFMRKSKIANFPSKICEFSWQQLRIFSATIVNFLSKNCEFSCCQHI